MSGKAARVVLVLAGALALAACGPGADNNQPPRRQSVRAGPAAIPPQEPSSASQPPSDNSGAAPATGASSGTGAPDATFTKVAGQKGYITRDEASRIPWLEAHFAECDTKADGHISRAEFDICRHRLAQPHVQQLNAPVSGGKQAPASGAMPAASSGSAD